MAPPLLLRTVVAPVFGANCYVLSAPGGACVIVDTGAGTAQEVVALVRKHALEPVAVLATHGHVDHTWDAAAVCDELDVPLLLHEADAYRVADPFGTLGLGSSDGSATGLLAEALRAMGIDPRSYREPSRVVTFATRPGVVDDLDLGDLGLRALHAPGHTEGSTFYLVDLTSGPAALTGDVLFAGTIGRTDLPGGDSAAMARTLRDVVPLVAPDARLFPGHGPATSLAAERRSNPFLAG
ncbi:putative metallo-hydrolase [mine drainage metagenome]|uniref:Putative metallo-hydrolase n=1 Tax=mine drainage metagenome TaxID=410659 RepID=A0A1J5R094_9ZZZZ